MIRNHKHRLAALKIVRNELRRIKFAKLERPNVYQGEAPTLELLDWATKLYCFSMLSHFRELLNSLIVLSNAGHVPGGFVISRCLYEIGAHSYYVQKHIKQYRKANAADAGWKFMQSINMGSLYMRQKKPASTDPFPEPRGIGKIMRTFCEWPDSKLGRDNYRNYSYLSEFTHPNMAALKHYFNLEPKPSEKKIFAVFAEPPRDVEALPLAEVTFAAAAILVNIAYLLKLAGEQDLGKKLKGSVYSLTKGKPKSFTARLSALKNFIRNTAKR